MRAKPQLVPVAAALALSLAVSGCGFDEELTTRGFVVTGDALCVNAAGRSALAAERARDEGAILDESVIRTLAGGYASLATGLRPLDVHDDDEAIRNEMVQRYQAAADEIEEAADAAAAGDPGAGAQALSVIDGLRPFAAELRGFGFRACGGREPAA